MKWYWLIFVLAVVAALIAGNLGNLWAIPSNRLVLKADQISETSLRLFVDYSGTINPKTFGSYTQSHALTPDIHGDSDLPTSQGVCLGWNGAWSESQGVCDISHITQNAVLDSNALTWRGTEVQFVSSAGPSINLLFPSAQEAGCTQQQFFDDACTGTIQGTITFRLPSASVCGNGICDSGETQANCPADCSYEEYCGDGICNGPETSADCPEDCGASPPPGPAPTPNPFQFIIDAFAALWRLILSLFGMG